MAQSGNNSVSEESRSHELPTDLHTVLTDEWHEIRRRRHFMEALRRYSAARKSEDLTGRSEEEAEASGRSGYSAGEEPAQRSLASPPDNLIGLALSGGGIRSATFCLGAVQELADSGVLPGFDYLSSVSGGGYFSGWWSAWLSREPLFSPSDLADPSGLLNQLYGVPKGGVPHANLPERNYQVGASDQEISAQSAAERRSKQLAAFHTWNKTEIGTLRDVLREPHARGHETDLIVDWLNRLLAKEALYEQVPETLLSPSLRDLIRSLEASHECWRQERPEIHPGTERSKREDSAWEHCEQLLLNRLFLEDCFPGCFTPLRDPQQMIFPRPEQIEPDRYDQWRFPGHRAAPAGAALHGGHFAAEHREMLPDQRSDSSSSAWSDPIHHLRLFANYLTPRKGSLSGDTWRAIAVVSRNLFLTWTVLLPICVTLTLIGQLYYLWHPITSPNFIREQRDSAAVQATAPGTLSSDTAAIQPGRQTPSGVASPGGAPSGVVPSGATPSAVDTAVVRNKDRLSSREVLLVRTAAAAQVLLPILGWIAVMVIAWVLSGQDGTALRHKVMPWVELIAVTVLILFMIWIFKKEVSLELGGGNSGEKVLAMLNWWVQPAPLIFWIVTALGLLAAGWWNTWSFSDKGADRKWNVQIRRQVRRNQLVRIHATLLVIGVSLVIVLVVSGFGHELINYLFYSPAPNDAFASFLKNAGGWGGLLLTLAGTIYTLIKGSPTGGGERERSNEESKQRIWIFAITPVLMIVLLGLLSAWWGHRVLGILVPADGAIAMDAFHVVERSKPLHYISFLGVFLCFIFTWYEMQFMPGKLASGLNIPRRYLGHLLLAVAIVLMGLLVGHGLWSISTGSFYGTLLAGNDTLLGQWSDGALRILLLGSHPAPKFLSVAIAGITGMLLLVRLLLRRIVPTDPRMKNRFIWLWQRPGELHQHARSYLPGEVLWRAFAAFLILVLVAYIIVLMHPWESVATVRNWLWEDATRNLTAYSLFGIVFCLVYLLVELALGTGTNNHSLGLLAGIFITLLVLLSVSYVPWEMHDPANPGSFTESDLRLLRVQSAFGLITALFTWTIATGWTVDPNMLSLHSFYKARLTRAYLGASNPQRRGGRQRITEAVIGDDVSLSELRNCRRGGPYHIINSTLNLVGGRDLATAQRSSANFVLTQEYCGSLRTGFRRTAEYMGGRMTLGTAVSVSGAAASPNMGTKTPTAALAMLMTLFNIRLGYWTPTPNRDGWRATQARLWPFLTLREFLSQTNDLSSFCYLTDGGHFDNTGLYALVERGCRCILLFDCGADPHPCFADLGEAIRRCRIDFGTEFELNVDPFTTDENKAVRGASHYVVGRIIYSEAHVRRLNSLHPAGDAAQKDGGASITSEEERTGYIIVVKPTLIDDKDETVDVRQYRRENKDFPQQSTSDQWFDESQFESYRKLGALSVEQILNDGKAFGWRQQSDRAGKPARPAEGEENIDSADVIRNLRQGQPPDPDEMWALFRTMYTQSQQERDKK